MIQGFLTKVKGKGVEGGGQERKQNFIEHILDSGPVYQSLNWFM